MDFTDLLAPLGVTHFVADHFDRRPLHLPANAAKRRLVARLFDRERLTRAIARDDDPRRQEEDGFSVRAIFPPSHAGPPEIRITASQVETLLAAGASVCVHDLHRADRELATLVSTAKHALNFVGRVGMSCYVSPAGYGLGPHFDAQGVLTLQVEGEKTWRYSEAPAVPVPRANAVVEASGAVEWVSSPPGDLPFPELGPPPRRLTEVKLQPGDLLYLPAGHWHQTLAGSPSMGLTLYFVPLSFSALLERWLWSSFEGHDAWIRGVPASVSVTGELERRPPDTVVAYLSARLQELQALLSTTDATDPSLLRAWHRFIGQDGPPSTPSPPASLRRDDLVRVADARRLRVFAGDHASLHVCFGGQEITLPSSLEPLVHQLLGEQPFRAGAVASIPWATTRKALQVLLTEGVLERA